MWRTTGHGLFFIGSGCGQIRGVDDSHGLSSFGQETQESPDQLLINPAPGGHACSGAKIAEHRHIGCGMPVMEQPKTPPGRRLWKPAHDGIETVRRTQHRQPMNPPKPGGAEVVATSLAAIARQQAVDELVRNIGRKRIQQFGGSGGGKR